MNVPPDMRIDLVLRATVVRQRDVGAKVVRVTEPLIATARRVMDMVRMHIRVVDLAVMGMIAITEARERIVPTRAINPTLAADATPREPAVSNSGEACSVAGWAGSRIAWEAVVTTPGDIATDIAMANRVIDITAASSLAVDMVDIMPADTTAGKRGSNGDTARDIIVTGHMDTIAMAAIMRTATITFADDTADTHALIATVSTETPDATTAAIDIRTAIHAETTVTPAATTVTSTVEKPCGEST